MTPYQRAQCKAEILCWQGIDEICEIALKEGCVEQVLKALAMILHGEILPKPIVQDIQKRIAAIRAA